MCTMSSGSSLHAMKNIQRSLPMIEKDRYWRSTEPGAGCSVMLYNRLSLRVNAIEQNYGNFIDEFTTILHRQAFGKAPH